METGKVLGTNNGTTVIGWRVWTVQESHAGLRLGSVIYEALWTPGDVARAACAHDHLGAVPAETCNCGFHAVQDPVDAFSYLHGRDEPRTICRVLGEVSLSGLLVQTERGWRGSEAYPRRLYVRDPAVAEALAAYRIPVLSPACGSASATSSGQATAGSPTSSWSAARMPSSWPGASG
jgi:hypothetical protein